MRYIVLEYFKTTNNIVTFKILKQSHIRDDFNPTESNSHEFVGRNGFILSSISHPATSKLAKKLYMHGRKTEYNNRILSVTIDIWDKIVETVQEYNDLYEYTGCSVIGYDIPHIVDIIPKEFFTLD